MSKLAIIANPNAHRNRLWPLAAQALRKAAPGAPILETSGPEELRRAASQVAAGKYQVVAIAGGDGTVQHTVTALDEALRGELPPLALLGGGAYDSLASLGGRGDAEDRLRRLHHALAEGAPLRTEERDTLRADGRCGFRLGVGLPVRFVEEFYRRGGGGGVSGRIAGAALLLRALGSSLAHGPFSKMLYQPLQLSVEVDGEEWPPLPLYGLVCASVAESGLGLRPFRRATEQPGAFQVLGLTAGPLAFALELPRLVLGRPVRRDRLLDAVAERVDLRGKRPFSWFLDGELHQSSGALHIGLGPRVRLVRA